MIKYCKKLLQKNRKNMIQSKIMIKSLHSTKYNFYIINLISVKRCYFLNAQKLLLQSLLTVATQVLSTLATLVGPPKQKL